VGFIRSETKGRCVICCFLNLWISWNTEQCSILKFRTIFVHQRPSQSRDWSFPCFLFVASFRLLAPQITTNSKRKTMTFGWSLELCTPTINLKRCFQGPLATDTLKCTDTPRGSPRGTPLVGFLDSSAFCCVDYPLFTGQASVTYDLLPVTLCSFGLRNTAPFR